jgi:phosphoglycolate phosphatase
LIQPLPADCGGNQVAVTNETNPTALFLEQADWRRLDSNLKYRLAIFDSDGTLADTLPWARSIFNELAEEHSFKRVEPHEYERFRDLPGGALLRELGLPLWKLPRVVSSMRRRMAKHTGKFSLFPGISDVLRDLRIAGVHLAIVSSNSRENVEHVLGLENAKLIRHFACGVSMFGKAAKLRQVLRRSAIQPQHAIYIGDELRDAEAAGKAGIAFGAVTWGQHSAEALRAQSPAEIFSTAREIVDKLC